MSETNRETGYVDYVALLGLPPDFKPGDARRVYRKMMKDLLVEISRTEITEERKNHYLLEIARLNAAFYILRDRERCEKYLADRQEVMALEEEWRAHADAPQQSDLLRRKFDQALRHFLSTYMEELMLEAGRDPECVECSNWDAAHERHASRVLRHYRQRLYQIIHERLPYYDITAPRIDWEERKETARATLDVLSAASGAPASERGAL
ncbi:MAG TPA: hypothetical protein PLX03_08020 [Candidatus Hydrogenedentes bacterium]|nr:hypothetical protein [Candidatus Hydrogenedentota bacterium]